MDLEYKIAYAKQEAAMEQAKMDAETKAIANDDDAPAAHELARQLKTVEVTMNYLHAGKATFTIRSQVTGKRFTYRITKPKEKDHKSARFEYDPNIWFVKVLYGPDNNSHYRYFGLIRRTFEQSVAYPSVTLTKMTFYPSTGFKHVEVSRSPSSKAFAWAYEKLSKGKYPEQCEIWHSGTCGHCGKLLTVPESIEAGIGPVCQSKGW